MNRFEIQGFLFDRRNLFFSFFGASTDTESPLIILILDER